MNRRKIVWFAHESNKSGANIAMVEYAEALKYDYEFHFVIPHQGNMIEYLTKKGFSTSIIHQYNWTLPAGSKVRLNRFRILFRSLFALVRSVIKIKNQKAQIIFTNTQAPFVGSIAARLCRLPHIWWIHEFGEEDFGFEIGFGNKNRAYRWIQKNSCLIIGNSEAVKSKFKALMPSANVKRLYQPVSVPPADKAIQSKNAFLMFGQILPSKGHLEVLEAFAILREEYKETEIKLDIYGPCENEQYLESLKSFLSKNKLQNHVKIHTGFFNREEIMPQYKTIIVASNAEAFGRVIIEANKYGLRAIVKNAGGAPELINNTNGDVYNNTNELVSILLKYNLQTLNYPLTLNYEEGTELNNLKKWLAKIH